jgi:AraC-like DNA-binding protein/ligand-binding sensor protein
MKENNEKIANLLERAEKVMYDYVQSTGSCICIYDSSYKPQFTDCKGSSPERLICPYCVKNSPKTENTQESYPCYDIHVNAIKEANKKGGAYVYRCSMGLLFWTSPIYTEGVFSGAIRGCGYILKDNKTLKNCEISVDFFSNANDTHVMCNNEITQEEFKERINSFPGVDGEKVQSLAEMMQLCAESLSSGSEDYHKILKRRAEQQEAITKIVEELRKRYPEAGQKTDKQGYPLDKERLLLAILQRGECDEAKKTLNELLAMLVFFNPEQFKYVQLRVTELVVLISRVEISPMKGGNLSIEANTQVLKQVQEAKTIEELTDILHTMIERISGVISSFRGIPHAAALRKAEIFIMENFTKKISLKEIASVAGLSAPYFSTIFKDEMGENLSKYLNRLRVEKASHLLLETEMPLGEIAACCCFEDQSWFSKIFKAYTGISPGKYRNQGGGLIKRVSEKIRS